MAEFFALLATGAGLLFAAGFGALLLTYLLYAAGWALAAAAENLSGRLGAAFGQFEDLADDQARRRQIEDEIDFATHPQAGRGRVDRQFVQAAQATKCISAALKVVGSAMETCCEVQRFTAQAQGAADMAEVEWDPLCVGLRQRVLASLDVALGRLQQFPGLGADRQLLKQAVALRCLRPVCEDCELLRYSVSEAPPLCTPAASMSRQTGGRGSRRHA